MSKGYDFVLVSAAGNDDKPTYVNNYRVITERGWDNKFHENRGIDARYNSFVNMIGPNKHPEIYNRIIVVGNIKEGYDISSTSMTGERVDIYAPGEYIYSTLPDNNYGGADSSTKESGTSFAAPHVAGAAADVWSINNSLDGKEVKKIVCEAIHSKSKKDPNGKYKYPVLDLEKAVNAAFETKTNSNYKNVQFVYGSIMGFVADAEVENPEESFISGAEITVFRQWNDTLYEVTPKDDKEFKERKADKNGHFELTLSSGTYDLMISADGYDQQMIPDVEVKSQEVTYLDDWVKLSPKKIVLTELANMSTDEIVRIMKNDFNIQYVDNNAGFFIFNNYDVFPDIDFFCSFGDYQRDNSNDEWDEDFLKAWVRSGAPGLMGLRTGTQGKDYFITSDLHTDFAYKDIAGVIGDFSCANGIAPFVVTSQAANPTKIIEQDDCKITLQFPWYRNDMDQSMTVEELKASNPKLRCVGVEPKQQNLKYEYFVEVSADQSIPAEANKDTALKCGPSDKWGDLLSVSKDTALTILHNKVKYSGEYWYYVVYDAEGCGWIKEDDLSLITDDKNEPPSGNDTDNVREVNGHRYQLFDESMTWTEAKAYCESLGGHLVTVSSEEEQDIIVSLIRNGDYKAYWLGGYIEDGNWKWVTGEDFSYSNWDPKEPNGGSNKFYLQIYNEEKYWGLWDDTWNNGDHGGGIKQEGIVCEWDDYKPETKKESSKKWIIFYEGYRHSRLEMSSIIAPDNCKIVWNRNVTCAEQEGDCEQFYFDGEKWVGMGTYHILTDWATDIVASNADIYDSSGNIVIHKTDIPLEEFDAKAYYK